MENKLLQPLLQAGLLDIGDSDERLANIEKSIADVEAKLKKEQNLLPAYALVALDPFINSDEPVIVEVEAIIAAHWKALRAKFSETPVSIIRAVILHALYNVGTTDSKIARIIYLTTTNFYPYAKLGREKEVVEKMITELGELAEKNASEEWSLETEEPKLKLSTLKISGITLNKVSVDEEELEENLKTAASNTPQGHNPTNHNPQWSKHFAENAASGISTAFNNAFSEIASSLSAESIEVPVNKFFIEFKKSLDQTLKSSFNSIQAVERRSKLLWWKETLYSSSLKDSYRSVNETVQPIIMADDLFMQLPDIVPVSVDYLLKDTLLLLNNKADEKIKFSELLEALSKESNKASLKRYFADIDSTSKRISVTDFIALFIHGKAEPSSLKQYTGIESDEEVSLTDIAVMILHDSMAEHLLPKSK